MKQWFKKKRKEFSALAFLLRPAWKHGRGYMITSLLYNVTMEPLYTLLTVYFIQAIVNAFTQDKPLPEVLVLALLFQGGLLLTRLIRHLMIDIYHSKAWPKFCQALQEEIYRKTVDVDYKFMDNAEYFDKYTYTLQNYFGKVDDAIEFLNNFFKALAVIASLAASIASNDLFVIVISVVTLLVSNFIAKKKNRVNHDISIRSRPLEREEMYVDRVYYMRDLAGDMRCSTLPHKIADMYRNALKKRLVIADQTKWKRFGFDSLSETTGILLQIGIVFYLCWRISSGAITIGSFAGLIYAADALRINLNKFLNLGVSLNDFALFVDASQEFFSIESQIERPENPGEDVKRSSEPISLSLRDVCFHYENSDFSLKKINMEIKKGQKIAIVGFNGSGKTTLIKLLLRLYDADSGAILVNGHDIRSLNVHDLRKNIGIAFQDTNLYAFSLRDNALLYDQADDETICKAMNYFELDEIFQKDGVGLDTPMTREFSKEGIMLSGGEAQKLALVRIFLNAYGLLVLDEPSSALDPIAEYNMNKKIFEMSNRATTILISHRLTSARNADRIYLFENGEIVESGTHEELMQKGGKYCEMFTKQAENYQI